MYVYGKGRTSSFQGYPNHIPNVKVDWVTKHYWPPWTMSTLPSLIPVITLISKLFSCFLGQNTIKSCKKGFYCNGIWWECWKPSLLRQQLTLSFNYGAGPFHGYRFLDKRTGNVEERWSCWRSGSIIENKVSCCRNTKCFQHSHDMP